MEAEFMITQTTSEKLRKNFLSGPNSSEMSQNPRLKLTHDSGEVQGNDCSTIQAV